MVNSLFNDSNINKFLVGFDSFFNSLDQSQNAWDNYPPFNLIKENEDTFIVSMAATGFTSDEIFVTQHKGDKPHLLIEGKSMPKEGEKAYMEEAFLHRGLSRKDFSKSFITGQYVNVTDVSLENGILDVTLRRDVPDEAKPKSFKVSTKK